MPSSSRRRFSRWLSCGTVALALSGPILGQGIEFKLPPPPPPKPAPAATAEETPPTGLPTREQPTEGDAPPPPPVTPGVPVKTWLDAQVALAREGYSAGPIDGVGGVQTAAALRAYQEQHDLAPTGALDKATCAQLQLTAPLLTETVVTADDFAKLQPLSPTWLGKSQQTSLAYETVLELVAERFHASHNLIKKLNPAIDWDIGPEVGATLTVPNVSKLAKKKKAGRVMIQLAAHTLQVFDEEGALIAHFPVSIASRVEKRPVGELHVVVVAPNPDYTFNPEVFPESEEARSLGRKLMLPPGPNNPVGLAWIGLDLPGYGIHGTPRPDQVGRTESHGCFRLANWDALTLLDVVSIGLPVVVLP